MEESVLDLLRATQLSAAEPRIAAELQLKGLYANEAFPPALVTIGAHHDIPVPDRLAALLSLKAFVNARWSPALEDYEGGASSPAIGPAAKQAVRDGLLAIVYDSAVESKVAAQTAAVVATVAKSDFPEEWPGLLESLLGQVARSGDEQVQAILVVLGELIAVGLDEDSFYQYAEALLNCLRGVAIDGRKRLMVRAHAVHTFRACFDFVENLKDKDQDGAIRHFTKNVCDAWAPFFLDVVKEPMPQFPTTEEEEDSSNPPIASAWRGVVSLKIQVVLTLAKIQAIYPDIVAAQDFFNAIWDSIQAHGAPYYASYVDGERQGGLINQHQIPYTFDFLVIEEIDYLQALLEAPQVRQQLDEMLASDTALNGSSVSSWIASVLGTLVTFSSITKEAEEMWEMDFNVFLSEETFAELNNSPRSVCAGFVWKICSWFPQQTLESLLGYIKMIFGDPNSNWRHKEAALFTLQQIAEEYDNESRAADPNVVRACIEYTRPTMKDGQQFLRARGHIVTSAIMIAWMDASGADQTIVLGHAQESLLTMENDESEIVKTACIRIMRDYLTILPSPQGTELQARVVNSIAEFLDTRDFDDHDANIDLIDVVLQTLRDTIMANPVTCLEHNGLDVLLMMVKYGAAREDHTGILIDEAFTSAAEAMAKQGGDAYPRLCHKVLPSLMAAFDVEDPTTKKMTALTDVSASVLKILAETAVDSLPQGFVAAVMPRLCRLIFAPVDFYLKQAATLTIKHMLTNDKDQVFAWMDPELNKNGLEMCFMVIEHLLGPAVDDISAAEVGELAVSIVEKAGPSALGTNMHELLRVLAIRLSTAEHLGLIQSLTLVFARLSLFDATDLLSFLAALPIDISGSSTTPNNTVPTNDLNSQNNSSTLSSTQTTALAIVLPKWLENTPGFVGFDAIRQNVSALVALYRAHDPRLAALVVNGDLIPDTGSRIRTRSVAKTRPIRHTRVSAPLKIVKLLVAELLPYGDPGLALATPQQQQQQQQQQPLLSPGLSLVGGALATTGAAQGNNSSDGSWESDEEGGPSSLGGSGGGRLGGAGAGKPQDDATQKFLVEFFRAEGADPRFQALYAELSVEERSRCMDAVEQWAKWEAVHS